MTNRLPGLALAYRTPAQEWLTTWIHCGAPILTEYGGDSNKMRFWDLPWQGLDVGVGGGARHQPPHPPFSTLIPIDPPWKPDGVAILDYNRLSLFGWNTFETK
jgi:hypothetical protein